MITIGNVVALADIQKLILSAHIRGLGLGHFVSECRSQFDRSQGENGL